MSYPDLTFSHSEIDYLLEGLEGSFMKKTSRDMLENLLNKADNEGYITYDKKMRVIHCEIINKEEIRDFLLTIKSKTKEINEEIQLCEQFFSSFTKNPLRFGVLGSSCSTADEPIILYTNNIEKIKSKMNLENIENNHYRYKFMVRDKIYYLRIDLVYQEFPLKFRDL